MVLYMSESNDVTPDEDLQAISDGIINLTSTSSGRKLSITKFRGSGFRGGLHAMRLAPTTINRALISLMLFFDTIDGTNPFRNLTMIDIVEPAPVALSKTEWNAVRRCAEQAARRDHGSRGSPDSRCADLRTARVAHYSPRQGTQAS
jgi:hypothetical protein